MKPFGLLGLASALCVGGCATLTEAMVDEVGDARMLTGCLDVDRDASEVAVNASVVNTAELPELREAVAQMLETMSAHDTNSVCPPARFRLTLYQSSSAPVVFVPGVGVALALAQAPTFIHSSRAHMVLDVDGRLVEAEGEAWTLSGISWGSPHEATAQAVVDAVEGLKVSRRHSTGIASRR